MDHHIHHSPNIRDVGIVGLMPKIKLFDLTFANIGNVTVTVTSYRLGSDGHPIVFSFFFFNKLILMANCHMNCPCLDISRHVLLLVLMASRFLVPMSHTIS
uniref:Uncharacterized protein n=1 Tax=Cacopsylla melanoneura TaxID=428564 RepID=A0A8D8WHQ8_9HEMI